MIVSGGTAGKMNADFSDTRKKRERKKKERVERIG